MFTNVLMTTLTPPTTINHWEDRPPLTTVWSEESSKKLNGIPRNLKKKKRVRTAYTTEQLKVLEKTFIRFRYIDISRRKELASTLNINEKNIKVWFQNRRMKEKKESSESSCDSSTEILHQEVSPASHSPSESIQCESPKMDDYKRYNLNTQYVLPTFYYEPVPNHFCYNNAIPATEYQDFSVQNPISPVSETFSNEGIHYPTGYYPNYQECEYPNNQNQYRNMTMGAENWSPHTFDLSYFS
ncbi:homeobox protein ceh-43-like [Achroia grisella]|uniref:homeobox protein ceh-43-like n=1 Tax=Achroia grisella TaxID=688607 RepID=UPI0027D32695|nr:homeobox protein ceh-43-like [Achroia grisella]